MPPNPRVAKAFRAMKDIGITEDKVKPVLKNLLKLYQKNWELIEEENYRVLADAIFDNEEAQVQSLPFPFSFHVSSFSTLEFIVSSFSKTSTLPLHTSFRQLKKRRSLKILRYGSYF